LGGGVWVWGGVGGGGGGWGSNGKAEGLPQSIGDKRGYKRNQEMSGQLNIKKTPP